MNRHARRDNDGDASGGRRLADHGRAARALSWFRDWGLLVLGVWLTGVSVVLLVVAVEFAQSQKATESKAYQGCVRTKLIGPYVVLDYSRRDALPPKVLAAYRQLIPTDCGSKPKS